MSIITIFTDALKVFLSPKSFSNVKPERVSILTMIVYIALVTILSMLIYNILFRPIPEKRMLIILIIAELWTIGVIKVIAAILRLRSKSQIPSDDNVAQLMLTTATIPGITWPFITGIVTLLWDALEFGGLLVPLLFTIYVISLLNTGFKEFVKLDKDLALMGTLFYVLLNLAIGVIINGIQAIIVYG
ncbi:hypothetical protein J4450_07890 [Candidatus Micrarchaeota archaeon]|nr:hypothetical protein [Candidatus Micrarchaeota archaeon]